MSGYLMRLAMRGHETSEAQSMQPFVRTTSPVAERDLPLAAAAERLRGKPGRPRKAPAGHTSRHTGPVMAVRAPRNIASALPVAPASTPDVLSLGPRLLGAQAAAVYLSISTWTVPSVAFARSL